MFILNGIFFRVKGAFNTDYEHQHFLLTTAQYVKCCLLGVSTLLSTEISNFPSIWILPTG